MPFIAVNDIQLHYQKIGPTAGETIVMLHGLILGSLATWYFTSAPLLARQYQVIMIDFRGHGKSDKAISGYDVKTLTQDVHTVIQHFKLQHFSIAGHSYGGLVALRYTLEHARNVNQLALIDTPLPPFGADLINRFVEKSPKEMIADLPDWQQQMLLKKGRRKSPGWLRTIDFLTHQTTLLDDIKREPHIEDSDYSAVTAPVLLAYGTHSPYRHDGLILSGKLQRSKLVHIQGGHNLPVESSMALNGHLSTFFRRTKYSNRLVPEK